jgi:hypothetical protein
MKSMKPLYVIIIIVIVGAAAFFGGMQYQKSQQTARFGQFANSQDKMFGNGQFRPGGQGGQFGGRRNGGAVMGEILNTDANSMTVKLPDGSSKIVVLSKSTAINKSANGTKEDLKTGERVAVFGTANSDGSVTAQNIQLNPQMRVFGGTPTPGK